MKQLLSCSEAARLDRDTQSESAFPSLLLMEDAAQGLWQAIQPEIRGFGSFTRTSIVALCGPGNNGGDALAVLRLARFAGYENLAAILTREPEGSSVTFADSLRAMDVPLLLWPSEADACRHGIAQASILLDGLSGTGLAGALHESQASLLEAVEAARTPSSKLFSIDLPSGLSDAFEAGWPLCRADLTLSIEPRKACLYFPQSRDRVGEIRAIEAVFRKDRQAVAEAELLEAEDCRSLAALPPESFYKGNRGRLAIFAGSIGATGAAILASHSALAAGAGIVTLYAASNIYSILAGQSVSAMVKPQPELGDLQENIGCYDAILVGPGWGKGRDRLDLLARLLALDLPVVLDADAISLYRDLVHDGYSPKIPVILSPHPGEFQNLTGTSSRDVLSNPLRYLGPAVRDFKANIILKSHVTWIAAADGRLSVWDGNEAGLGTAGSGDVLAGLAAGLLARGLPAYDAARAAVITHGLAGKRCRNRLGWFESSSLPEEAGIILGGRETDRDGHS